MTTHRRILGKAPLGVAALLLACGGAGEDARAGGGPGGGAAGTGGQSGGGAAPSAGGGTAPGNPSSGGGGAAGSLAADAAAPATGPSSCKQGFELSAACQACLETSCCDVAVTCASTDQCLPLFNCLRPCPANDASCLIQCFEHYPSGGAQAASAGIDGCFMQHCPSCKLW